MRIYGNCLRIKKAGYGYIAYQTRYNNHGLLANKIPSLLKIKINLQKPENLLTRLIDDENGVGRKQTQLVNEPRNKN